MNTEEYQRHAHAQRLLQIIATLQDANREICKLPQYRIKFLPKTERVKIIDENITAITLGIAETIAIASHERAEIRNQMTEPDATPFKDLGSTRCYLTPSQKRLEQRGANLSSQIYEPIKRGGPENPDEPATPIPYRPEAGRPFRNPKRRGMPL